MMYTIKVRDEFSGAHNLRGYQGKCENLHGHNWKVEIAIADEKLDKSGMIADFRRMKKALSGILEKLDHKYLNDMPYFKKHNPTSENIAKFIFDALDKKIYGISQVSVWETDSSCAIYSR